MIKGQTKPTSNCKTVSWRTLLSQMCSAFKSSTDHWFQAPFQSCSAGGAQLSFPGSQAVLLHSTRQAIQQGKVMGWQGSTQHPRQTASADFSPSRIGKYSSNGFISHCWCRKSKPSLLTAGLLREGNSWHLFVLPKFGQGIPECVGFVKSDSLLSHSLE